MAIYYNFYYSLYNNIQQYCQKFIILIIKLKDINLKPTFKDQNIIFFLNIYPKYKEWVLWKYSKITMINIYISIIQLMIEICNEDELM